MIVELDETEISFLTAMIVEALKQVSKAPYDEAKEVIPLFVAIGNKLKAAKP